MPRAIRVPPSSSATRRSSAVRGAATRRRLPSSLPGGQPAVQGIGRVTDGSPKLHELRPLTPPAPLDEGLFRQTQTLGRLIGVQEVGHVALVSARATRPDRGVARASAMAKASAAWSFPPGVVSRLWSVTSGMPVRSASSRREMPDSSTATRIHAASWSARCCGVTMWYTLATVWLPCNPRRVAVW